MIRQLTPTFTNIATWVRAAAEAINQLVKAAEALAGRVDGLETRATALEADVTAIDGRVTVLEAPETIKFTPLAADPASPVEGWVYANSVTHKLRYYDGTAWNDLF